ncbi:TetR/AcrR family transcriptional regulator [Actinoplanes sp. NBRC 103695]|uniref:TetR/AcrR family transcriptional regulator n=1 Tax=Actinoplanes sp. NBRC 103695 TaxID=3032202 RepID=UPI002553752F|nr:TetR/AcrR family transcriptional regulator [Actinoplanes sp. NBRC 103695]
MTESTDRRPALADAAIAIVARDGLRALTHRAVDRELDLPAGSTSYYLRTRRQLIEAIVHRLATRTVTDLRPVAAPARTVPAAPARTVPAAAKSLAAGLDLLAQRPDDHRARYALSVDLTSDPELHALITSRSPIRAGTLAAAEAALDAIGVRQPARHAPGLVALIDGLLFDRVAGGGLDPDARPPAEPLIRAYLTGLKRGPENGGAR